MFTYAPLFATLHIRKKKLDNLQKDIPLSSATVARFNKDKPVSLDVLDKVCTYLECDIQDILKHNKS
jgi:DNA-binding Xre family transcriptional regulator